MSFDAGVWVLLLSIVVWWVMVHFIHKRLCATTLEKQGYMYMQEQSWFETHCQCRLNDKLIALACKLSLAAPEVTSVSVEAESITGAHESEKNELSIGKHSPCF